MDTIEDLKKLNKELNEEINNLESDLEFCRRELAESVRDDIEYQATIRKLRAEVNNLKNKIKVLESPNTGGDE
tara:strand:- start:409 stop:627 length:219 start_codon:yes stop_codon:yes gene_type:complete